jgi:hypothetical protein
MGRSLDRRSFLQHSFLLGGSLFTCGIPLDRSANAAPVRIEARVVEEVTIREVTDNAHDLFAKPFEAPWPRSSRPDESEELAPPHSITSSARPMTGMGTET